MRVFIYEFITGGGMWSLGEAPAGSLPAEGRAMADALCEDFVSMGAEVCSLIDARLRKREIGQVERVRSAEEERELLARFAAWADWTVVIAPESGGILIERCQRVVDAGGHLLSPGPVAVALASDKEWTAEHLAARGIRVPRGVRMTENLPNDALQPNWYPAVIKPLDGCGSHGVRLLTGPEQLREFAGPGPTRRPMRLEPYVPGLPASVAVLCGPGARVPLPACRQLLTADGRFTYLGGQVPLPAAANQRAQSLAVAAVQSLEDPFGYVGVDLVLGDDDSGDYVIEVNPRLTTSYVGLRALCRDNLAAAMVAVAEGRPPALSWHEGVVEFSAKGRVVWLDGKAPARGKR